MSTLRARVENERLVLDTPTILPDGMVLDLVLDDEGDDVAPGVARDTTFLFQVEASMRCYAPGPIKGSSSSAEGRGSSEREPIVR